MKIKRIMLILTVAVLSITGLYGQGLKKGNLICIHDMDVVLRENASGKQFEEFMLNQYIPAFEKNVKGVKVYLLKGNSSSAAGRYAVVMKFKNQAAWSAFSPHEGELSEAGKACLEKMMPMESELYKIAETGFTSAQWTVL